MSLTSHEIQRELAWLMDARYKLNPGEFRPDDVCPKTSPRITVMWQNDSYVVTLTWEFTEAVSSISASDAKELLIQQSQPLIDHALHAHFGDRQYIRRPLYVEQEMSAHSPAVLVTPLSTRKLHFQPLKIFSWKNAHEFCCAESSVIEEATRLNEMIFAGNAYLTSFPGGTLVASA